jgi:hypothetical protein
MVVANGSEGEPASGKDRALLAYRPHLVLDGLQLVAGALGAGAAHVHVAAASADGVRVALAARRGTGLDRVPVTVTVAPEAFIAGEESAVVAAVSGRPAVPADKLRRVTGSGVGGAPTLVQNVETLANLALIARHGPGWFRTAGTTDEPGTFLATVGGAVAAPGVIEAGYGVRLGDLIDAAGGLTDPLQAVLLGGYHAGWVPARPELAVSRAALTPFGASPGAGVVLALPAHACGLAETARIAGYLAARSPDSVDRASTACRAWPPRAGPAPGHFPGGSVATNARARSSHSVRASSSSSAPSTRTQPRIRRPPISIGLAPGSVRASAAASGPTRTIRPSPVTPTVSRPSVRNAREPNIRLSVTAGRAASRSRTRSARASS